MNILAHCEEYVFVLTNIIINPNKRRDIIIVTSGNILLLEKDNLNILILACLVININLRGVLTTQIITW